MRDPLELVPSKKIVTFCKKHPIIAKMSLFGSALSGKLRDDSDIDLLVEFEPGKTPSLFTLINLEDELTTIVGRKTDLRTPEELSRYFRNEVVSQAKPLYVKS
jgi:predicted nucleotidyltransferase